MRNPFHGRKVLIIGLFLVVGAVFVMRLFYLQVIDTSYKLSASNNVFRYVTQYPARGWVYDRNNQLLVYNEAVYDLMVIPRLAKNIDTAEFCRIIGIEKSTFIQNMDRTKSYSRVKPSIFERQLSKETYGILEEKLYKFPGFFVQTRTLRKYTYTIAAHTLGYIGEVSPRQIEADPYYAQGDYIGISGIEQTYESVLRGRKGVKIKMVDVHNREVGSYQDGRFDTAAIMGNNLVITIDAKLQAYGEALMANKRGSIVAIEPSSGEVLALVSSPAYNPNLLVGRIRAQNYGILNEDSLKPLFNRALMATYPPGSTFKLANGLVGLHQGVITPQSRFGCAGRETKPIRCSHGHSSPLPLNEAIEHSCNPYFWGVFRSIIENPQTRNTEAAYNNWCADMQSLGFGNVVGLDLFSEQRGKIPLPSEYNKIYGKGRWRALTIRSLSIGQGEILLTPIQMANFAATIANRGFFYPPHLVKAIGKNDSLKPIRIEKHISNIEPYHFDIIIDGMHRVFTAGHGTARWYALPDILMCGKTGTAENPHGKDHSLFIAFAPNDDPKIAIAVVVENAGFGATWAVPIAVLMMEKYLKGEISRLEIEERMLNGKP